MLPMHPALAEEHIRDLHNAADRSRLVALARCCQPAAWASAVKRATNAVRSWLHAGQLGPQPNHCACP